MLFWRFVMASTTYCCSAIDTLSTFICFFFLLLFSLHFYSFYNFFYVFFSLSLRFSSIRLFHKRISRTFGFTIDIQTTRLFLLVSQIKCVFKCIWWCICVSMNGLVEKKSKKNKKCEENIKRNHQMGLYMRAVICFISCVLNGKTWTEKLSDVNALNRCEFICQCYIAHTIGAMVVFLLLFFSWTTIWNKIFELITFRWNICMI